MVAACRGLGAFHKGLGGAVEVRYRRRFESVSCYMQALEGGRSHVS